MQVVDTLTFILVALAVVIFWKLWSVLGQRTGRERPPFDSFSRDTVRQSTNDNVVTLPSRGAEPQQKPAEISVPADRWSGIAEAGSAVAAGLDAMTREDKTFDVKHFIAG